LGLSGRVVAAVLAGLAGLGQLYSSVSGVEVSLLRRGLGRRVLVLSDLHVHSGVNWRAVRVAERVRPDLVLVAGDTWDERSPADPWPVYETLRRVRAAARDAAAVLGNHELWAERRGRGPGLREGLRVLEDAGYMVLRDSVAELVGLRVAGLEWRDDPRRYRDAARGLAGVDIVVSHSPDAFPHLPGGKDLVMAAGHTHGGQLCLPVNVSVITNSVYGYRWGLYRGRGNTLYVTRGLGEMNPVRLFCSYHALVIE